jgi:hypothetical protein
MAAKTYTMTGAVYRSVVIRVKTAKGETPVKFDGGMLNLSRPNCFFTTNDEELQTALEKHKLFKASGGFVLSATEKTVSDETPSDANPSGAKAAAGVKSFNEAKKYILENHSGYTQADVTSAEKVKEVAATLGITFPNWGG